MSDAVLRVSQWCYEGVWRGLTQWMRVPRDPPKLPSTEGEAVASFRPSEAYLNYIKFFFWIGLVVVDVILTGLWIALAVYWPLLGILITPLALAIIVLPDVLAYIAIHLRFDTTWYLISDRSMRIRRGLWKIHETTITFENIQNIRLQQGPLQRYFGFANLIVETAGGGAGAGHHGESMMGAHVGFLEGLDQADAIRDQMMLKLRSSRSAGLGDDALGALASRASSVVGLAPAQVELLRQIRDLTARLAEAA
jgi:membrane protein YdbS with pleckstrin-like domain